MLMKALLKLVQHGRKDYAGLKTAWLAAVAAGAKNSVLNAIHYQAKALWQTETIAALAEKRFLPRYGFPISVQSLTVQTDGAEEPVQFQRSSTLALSEYVPGSVLLGGGKSYSSHGVLSFWSETANRSFGLRKYLYQCANGHQWTELQPLVVETCPRCQAPLACSNKELLLPTFRIFHSNMGWADLGNRPRASRGLRRYWRRCCSLRPQHTRWKISQA